MGERLLCKQEVIGSIPFTSTTVATVRPALRQKPGHLHHRHNGLAGLGVLCCRSEKPEIPAGRAWSGMLIEG